MRTVLSFVADVLIPVCQSCDLFPHDFGLYHWHILSTQLEQVEE